MPAPDVELIVNNSEAPAVMGPVVATTVNIGVAAAVTAIAAVAEDAVATVVSAVAVAAAVVPADTGNAVKPTATD